MRRFILIAVAIGVGVALANAPARAGVVDDLLTALGLAPAPAPSSPSNLGTDFRNCDTGECE